MSHATTSVFDKRCTQHKARPLLRRQHAPAPHTYTHAHKHSCYTLSPSLYTTYFVHIGVHGTWAMALLSISIVQSANPCPIPIPLIPSSRRRLRLRQVRWPKTAESRESRLSRLVSCTIAVLCDDLCWLGRRLEGHGSGQSSYLLAIWSTRGKGRGPQQFNGQKPCPPLPNRRGGKPWSILGAHPLCVSIIAAPRAREERDEVCAAAGLLVASPAPMAQTNDQNQTKRPESNRSRSKIARPIAASHASCGCPGGAETKMVARSYP